VLDNDKPAVPKYIVPEVLKPPVPEYIADELIFHPAIKAPVLSIFII
jgi:hypothetical protein